MVFLDAGADVISTIPANLRPNRLKLATIPAQWHGAARLVEVSGRSRIEADALRAAWLATKTTR